MIPNIPLTDDDLSVILDVYTCFPFLNQKANEEEVFHRLTVVARINSQAKKIDSLTRGVHFLKNLSYLRIMSNCSSLREGECRRREVENARLKILRTYQSNI